MNEADLFLEKSLENLQCAESEFAAGRYNSCANRCYYSCFQAAIAALLREDIRPARGGWGHEGVQSQFSGVLIGRRKRFPSEFRSTLSDLQHLRNQADYSSERVAETQAFRALRRCREFVQTIQRNG
ncbi:MAG: HEPN domain-containing protein [Thermomicrobiales bacterium]